MQALMVRLIVVLIVGMIPIAAKAQQTVMIDGVKATRVVLAPPETPLANLLKAGLRAAYEKAQPGTRAYDDAQKLYFFYGARHFAPLWLHEGANGHVVFSANAKALLDVFSKAYLTGLNPADYLTKAIDLDAAGTTPEDLAEIETAFSAATISYANDTHSGRLRPAQISGSIGLTPDRLDDAKVLMDLASASDPAAYMQALEPQHPEFAALKKALDKFYTGTVEQTVDIPDGKVLHPGQTDSRLPLLRERLGLAPETETPELYDDATVTAVENFQASLGLVIDGIVGPATLAALNGGSAVSKADIIANMEMWRWEPENMGAFRVEVNVPEFRLRVIRDGQTVYTTRVVTGKKDHMTPIFSDEMEYIVVNPYWNVPRSIASKEIAPKLAANPGYISRNNMQVLYGGKVVDAAAIDWSEANIDNFRIRQLPGTGNALGSIKFLFPNNHDVYLHDTPSKYLFQRSYRAYSHGCVRVQDPWDLAQVLVNDDEPQMSFASLEAQRGGSEQWNSLKRHIPIHIMYLTLRVDPDGTLRSYGDVYGHIAKIERLLDLD